MSQTGARVRAPELPVTLEWLNTDRPVRLAEHRGCVVLLDFWTYCCVNCMHVLADLRYLEDKYGDDLLVIGVHSPKFPNERVGDQVRKAIDRHHIRHPVANDPTLSMWRQYAIRAWPSVIFIDPEGYAIGVLRGEGRRRQLDQLVAKHLEQAAGSVAERGPPVQIRARRGRGQFLAFPGKVLATEGRIYIADSGHNRVVEARRDGSIARVFGSTGPGFLDGVGEGAAFCNPQGLALSDGQLYVADTDNHAIRRIDLRHGEVQTVAGTGRQGRAEGKSYPDPRSAPLSSPWDVAFHNGDLYIAMAGQHQIWNLDLAGNVMRRFVGSGREDLLDGTADEAALAQPSGLAAGDFRLYVADAETSAVRSVRLPDGRVSTLVGSGLFEYGDRDARGTEARLQHPLGIAYDQCRRCVWLADTFNHKIKKIDLESNLVSSMTVAGLDEPGGISLWGDELWIANTNQHAIGRLDLVSGNWEPLELHED